MRKSSEIILAAGALGFALAFPVVLMFAVAHHAKADYSLQVVGDPAQQTFYGSPSSSSETATYSFLYTGPTQPVSSVTVIDQYLSSSSGLNVQFWDSGTLSCVAGGDGSLDGSTYEYHSTSYVNGSGGDCTLVHGNTINYKLGIGGQWRFYPYYIGGTDIIPYVNFEAAGSEPPAGPIPSSIEFFEPEYGTTTASTSVTVGVQYTIGDDFATSTEGHAIERVGICVTGSTFQHPSAPLDLGCTYVAPDSAPASISTTTSLTQGDWTLEANLIADYGTVPAYAGCVQVLPFITCAATPITSTLSTSGTLRFAVVTSPVASSTGITIGNPDRANVTAPYTECSITQLWGCIQNAGVFLFWPDSDVLDWLGSMWDPMKTKPPFGYFNVMAGSVSGLNSTATSTFSLNPSGLFVDEIFAPIKTGMSAILVVGFIVGMYFRLKHLDI